MGYDKPGSMTEKEATRYQETIDRLRREDVRIPKMGIHQVTESEAKGSGGVLYPGEYVVVSSLFGGTRRKSLLESDIAQKDLAYDLSPSVRKDVIIQLTRMANAGVEVTGDCFKFIRDPSGKPIELDRNRPGIVIDLDVQALAPEKDQTYSNLGILQTMASRLSGPDLSFRDLMNTAFTHANNRFKPHLKKFIRSMEKHETAAAASTLADHNPFVLSFIVRLHREGETGRQMNLRAIASGLGDTESGLREVLAHHGAGGLGVLPKWIRVSGRDGRPSEFDGSEFRILVKPDGQVKVLERKIAEK